MLQQIKVILLGRKTFCVCFVYKSISNRNSFSCPWNIKYTSFLPSKCSVQYYIWMLFSLLLDYGAAGKFVLRFADKILYRRLLYISTLHLLILLHYFLLLCVIFLFLCSVVVLLFSLPCYYRLIEKKCSVFCVTWFFSLYSWSWFLRIRSCFDDLN